MNAPGQLVVFEDGSIGVPGLCEPTVIETLDDVAEFVRTEDGGRYRPLSGARTLPRAWRYAARSAAERAAVIDAVYPLAPVHAQQLAAGTLRLVSLDEVLKRQSGRYESTSALSPGGRTRSSELVCGECVRTPVWRGDSCDSAGIPCPEPCSVLVAFCREAALWERETPEPAAPDPAVAWAAFEEPGNELRERYLHHLAENA